MVVSHSGIAKASLDCAVAYAKQRKSFDQPISSLYAVQEKLSQMSLKIDASRLLIFKVSVYIAYNTRPLLHVCVMGALLQAAMLKDAGKPYIKDAAQAKLFASEAATYCSHQVGLNSVYCWLIDGSSPNSLTPYRDPTGHPSAGRHGIRDRHACGEVLSRRPHH